MFKKIFKKEIVTLRKYRPIFVTTDGVKHEGQTYNWGIVERLRCSIPKYIMIDIKSDGYIEDNKKVMYPLTNVVSIEWELVKELKLEDNFGDYTIFVSKLEE